MTVAPARAGKLTTYVVGGPDQTPARQRHLGGTLYLGGTLCRPRNVARGEAALVASAPPLTPGTASTPSCGSLSEDVIEEGTEVPPMASSPAEYSHDPVLRRV